MSSISSLHTTISQFSKLVLIESLDDGELHTGTRLRDELLHVCPKPIVHFTVKNRRQFFSVLRGIRDKCAFHGSRPIIHIDAHGSKELGLKIGHEFVDWSELGERLRVINSYCEGGLGVVLAACYGVFSFQAVDLLEPSPFAFLVAPPEVVQARDIETCMTGFYKLLFETQDLGRAQEPLAGHFEVIRSEPFFYFIFEKAFHMQCMGRGAKNHIERLVSKALVQQGDDVGSISDLRRFLKLNNRYPESTYQSIGGRFLHGRPLAPFDGFVELMKSRYVA